MLSEITNSNISSQENSIARNNSAWCVNGAVVVQKDELVSYINSSNGIHTDPLEFDLWSFWYHNKDRWPILHSIAMKIFHIPASSASSERQFSKSKRIIGCLRLAMSQQKLEDQVLVAGNPEITESIIREKIHP